MKTVKLEDVVDLIIDHRGKTPKKLGADFTPDGVPVASAMLVHDGSLHLDDCRFVSEETWRCWMKEPLRAGDVLLTSEAPLGRVASVESDRPIVLGQRLFALRANPSMLDSQYLKYWLISGKGQQELGSRSTGTTVLGIRQSSLREVEIQLPNMDDQRAIGEILGALDDKIAANMKYLQLLYEFIESWYVKFIEGYSLESVAVRDVAKVQLGGTPARGNPDFWGGDIPWINSGSCNLPIITKESEFISEAGLSGSSTKIICQGSTAIAITGATMGKVSYLGSDFAVNQSIVGVTPLVGEAPWVYFAIRSQVDELLKSATGAAQQHVNKRNIEELKIPYSSTLAERFGEIANVLLDKSVQIHFENQKLAQTRDELLPLLMDGRITLKDAERVVEEEV